MYTTYCKLQLCKVRSVQNTWLGQLTVVHVYGVSHYWYDVRQWNFSYKSLWRFVAKYAGKLQPQRTKLLADRTGQAILQKHQQQACLYIMDEHANLGALCRI